MNSYTRLTDMLGRDPDCTAIVSTEADTTGVWISFISPETNEPVSEIQVFLGGNVVFMHVYRTPHAVCHRYQFSLPQKAILPRCILLPELL